MESTDRFLGEALGQKYVEKYFPPEAKARMQEMVKNLLAAMKRRHPQPHLDGRRDQEEGPGKDRHLQSQDRLSRQVEGLQPRRHPARDAFFEDMIDGTRFVVEDDRFTIGKPVDRGRWGMTPPTSDAYYNPLLNEIVFPAGILQPPAFDMDAVDAVNYGAIGVVIGHEISHGFDDQGAQYDRRRKLAETGGRMPT